MVRHDTNTHMVALVWLLDVSVSVQYDMRRRPYLHPREQRRSYCGQTDKFGFAFDRMRGGRDRRMGVAFLVHP